MYHNLKTDAFVNYLGMCMLQTCIKPWKNSFRKFSPEHRDRCGRVVLWKSSCKTQEGGGLKMLQFLIQKLKFSRMNISSLKLEYSVTHTARCFAIFTKHFILLAIVFQATTISRPQKVEQPLCFSGGHILNCVSCFHLSSFSLKD